MRVILPVHHFPPRYTGGVEVYVARLARWLRAHGHEAEVVCIERLDGSGEAGVTARRDSYDDIPVWRLTLTRGPEVGSFAASYDNPRIGAWFDEHLERSRPDLVHLHGGYLMTPGVLAVAHRRGIATALTLHDYWFLCPQTTLLRGDGNRCAGPPDDPAECAWCVRLRSRRYRIPEQLSRGVVGRVARAFQRNEGAAMAARRHRLQKALGETDVVVAPSRFLYELFRPHVPEGRLHLLELGMDPALFQQPRAPAESRRLRVVYLGQIAPHKGVHVLAEAVRRLPVAGLPVELLIYGGLEAFPDYVASLRRMCEGDRRIQLCGRYDNERVGALLAEAAVIVAPSLWHEIGPLTVKEAFAMGVPAIVSALGNMPDLVHDEVDGLLVRPGDARDLARQIQRLRDDPGLLPRLRRGISRPMTIDDEMGRLLQFYAEAIGSAAITAGEPACESNIP